MKAQELRIGNLIDTIALSGKVHIPRGNPMVVGGVNLFKAELYFPETPFSQQASSALISLSDIIGIPLTEEWLVKFGFSEQGQAIRRNVTYYLELCWIKGDINPFRLQTINSGHTEPAKCQYVHQLQNLYFALTGKELEIK
jgi:hypothetical protein